MLLGTCVWAGVEWSGVRSLVPEWFLEDISQRKLATSEVILLTQSLGKGKRFRARSPWNIYDLAVYLYVTAQAITKSVNMTIWSWTAKTSMPGTVLPARKGNHQLNPGCKCPVQSPPHPPPERAWLSLTRTPWLPENGSHPLLLPDP